MLYIIILSVILNLYLVYKLYTKKDILKSDCEYSLIGYCNLYYQRGRLRVSCLPKESKYKAINCRPVNPKSEYIETIPLYRKN